MWWSNESQAELNSRLQCFINQYKQYSVEGVQVYYIVVIARILSQHA